jgi:type II secretory pathway component PulF
MAEEQYRVVMVLLFGVLIGAVIFVGIRFTGARGSSKRPQEKGTSRFQSCLASILALLGAVAIPCVYYLTYIFPKTLAMWADQGDDVSAGAAVVIQLSQLCQPVGLLLMPALLFAVIGCVIWAVYARKRQ